CVTYRRARLAGADGKALKQSGRDVGRRQSEEFLVRANLVVISSRKCPRQEHGLRKCQHDDANRPRPKLTNAFHAYERKSKCGQAARDMSDDPHAAALKIE